jgi:hypothetical protein
MYARQAADYPGGVSYSGAPLSTMCTVSDSQNEAARRVVPVHRNDRVSPKRPILASYIRG